MSEIEECYNLGTRSNNPRDPSSFDVKKLSFQRVELDEAGSRHTSNVWRF